MNFGALRLSTFNAAKLRTVSLLQLSIVYEIQFIILKCYDSTKQFSRVNISEHIFIKLLQVKKLRKKTLFHSLV